MSKWIILAGLLSLVGTAYFLFFVPTGEERDFWMWATMNAGTILTIGGTVRLIWKGDW